MILRVVFMMARLSFRLLEAKLTCWAYGSHQLSWKKVGDRLVCRCHCCAKLLTEVPAS